MITVTLTNFRSDWCGGVFPTLSSAYQFLYVNGYATPSTPHYFDGDQIVFDPVRGVAATVTLPRPY